MASIGAPAVSGNPEEIKSADYLTGAFPNPANETVTFTYNLPAKTKAAEILIYEIATGKLIKHLPLKTSEKQEQISILNFPAGMYVYTLFVEGIPVGTKKMVVVK